MKSIVFTSILVCLICTFLFGQQIETTNDMHFNGDSYRVCKIPITSQSIQRFQFLENKSLISHKEFITTKIKDSFYMIINASISDSFCNPLGYFAKNGQTIKNVDLSDGKGNFYLKPNGAILFTEKDITICESSNISSVSNIQMGIQSGPLLIQNGIINKQFNATSQNKNIRCGVGIFTNHKNEKFLVMCVSNNPITFYNFSQFFQTKLKCNNALCLESGNCVIELPYAPAADEYSNNVICNYLYFSAKP